MSKNQETFYKLFKAFILVCKKSIKKTSKNSHLLKRAVDQCRANSAGHFSFSTVRKEDYYFTATMDFIAKKKTQEFGELADFLSSHPVIGKRIRTNTFAKFGAPQISDVLLVADILGEYLRRNKSYNCNRRIILNIFDSALKFFSKNQFEAIVRCYVENVGIEGKCFQIDSNTKIESLTYQDIESIYNHNICFRQLYSGSWRKGNRFKQIKAVLSVKFISDIVFEGEKPLKEHYDPRYRGQIIINNVLSAIRLHSLGDVNSSPVTNQTLQLPFRNSESPWDDNNIRSPKIVDEIEARLYRHIRQTFCKLTKFREEHTDADLLLNRLWTTTHRNTDEDIIVDSCIALETLVKSFLVIRGGDRLTSRDIAIVIAHLLEKRSESRKRVYEIVREGFLLRNRVVHGDHMRLKAYVTFDKFSSIVRNAIRRVILNSPDIDRKKIEDLVL